MTPEDDIAALGKKLSNMSNEDGRQANEWAIINDMHACIEKMTALLKDLRKAENINAIMKKES